MASEVRVALLGAIGATASLEVTIAEAARSALWAYCRLSRQTSIDEAAITTRDVLTLARNLVSPLHRNGASSLDTKSVGIQNADDSPDSEISIGRDILDLLAEQGDVQALASGRWIPSPLRLVPISGMPFSLLVGCQPAHELPLEAQRALHFFGTFRRIVVAQVAPDVEMLAASLHILLQPLTQWLGTPPPTRDDLLAWMHAADLAPIAQSQSTAASSPEAEAYAPYVDKPQGLRWTPLRHLGRDGRYLLRQRTSWGDARFTFGEARHGELTAQSGALPRDRIRRLQYALDWQAHMPTRAEWDRQRGVLVLHSEVPARERKLLSALGLLDVQGASYYPRRWIGLPIASAAPVAHLFDDLGIEATTF